MFESLLTAEGLIGLITLVLMEIVLGIDNIIFIAILCGFLPKKEDQKRARTIGLTLALAIRVLLLFTISWIIKLVNPLFFIQDFGVTGRDLILFSGGVFLIYKTMVEIYHKVKGDGMEHGPKARTLTVAQAILQITIIDIVFSFDSILTAVGLSRGITIMVTAVVISMIVMLMFAPYVSDFINKYPSLKVLALVFLVAIGFLLVIESLHMHIDKSYVYVAMGFSLIVELLNIKIRGVKHK
ncbi:MAG: TerC family protein [Bacteroidetes bacterium]|nr:TerC family protein [Bacteroidota bacterium]